MRSSSAVPSTETRAWQPGYGWPPLERVLPFLVNYLCLKHFVLTYQPIYEAVAYFALAFLAEIAVDRAGQWMRKSAWTRALRVAVISVLAVLAVRQVVGFRGALQGQRAPFAALQGALTYVLLESGARPGDKVLTPSPFGFHLYFWDVPISLAPLGALVVALHYPSRASALLSASAALLGFAVWVRASWWPLALVYFGLIASSRALRRRLLVAIAIFAIVAAPQAWRSSRARGHFALSTRAAWHVALVGLGYYPNSYGLEANDESVFRLTREQYGITFQMQDYGPHDAAARLAYLDLLRKDPRFVVASFVGRFWESLTGTTTASARAYPGIPNPLHRALCLLGFLAMHRRGGARRLVGWLAAAWFVSYVGLTSLFYFVGLAYDNVSQVCLLFLLMGLLEATVGILARTSEERARPQGA